MDELAQALKVAYVLLDDGDRRAVAGAGLSQTQFNLLRAVEAAEGAPSVTELAATLLCTRGNVTRLVGRMAAQGLVRTTGDASDQRLVRVALSDEGKARLAQGSDLLEQADARRFDALGDVDREAITRLLAELTDHLRADLEQV